MFRSLRVYCIASKEQKMVSTASIISSNEQFKYMLTQMSIKQIRRLLYRTKLAESGLK